MKYTAALYYPWIEITDEAWLKNAMLYWEKVYTIVPSSMTRPYHTKTAQELESKGLLLPLRVRSDMREIEELAGDVQKYLDSPEGTEVLMSGNPSEPGYLHPDKLSVEVAEIVEMHPDKLPDRIRYALGSGNEWITVGTRFADFYMTLLATRLSLKEKAALLTDAPANDRLARAVRLDSRVSLPRMGHFSGGSPSPQPVMAPDYAQGILAGLVIERLQIDPDTPVEKIIKFRADHADELDRFRDQIAALSSSASGDQSLEMAREKANAIYVTQLMPALEALKRSLTDSGIRSATKNLVKVDFLYAGSGSMAGLLLGLGAQAVLGAPGVSLTASSVSYNKARVESLRQNPFSYVLSAERELHP